MMEIAAETLAVVGVCIAAVNVIVEVLKACWLKNETSIPPVVLITSQVMTFFVMYAYCVIENVRFDLSIAGGCFAGGFFVAYGAMFGYDKLYGKVLESIQNVIRGHESDKSAD